jgi:hypothetical protein
MKTISRVIAVLGLAAFMGAVPSAVKAQSSGAALLAPNNQQQSNNSGINIFFPSADYQQLIEEYNSNSPLNPGTTLVYNAATACAEAKSDPAINLSPDQAVLSTEFSPAGRQLTSNSILNCNGVLGPINSNSTSAAALTKQDQSAPLPSYQPVYVIRLGDTTRPNYYQRGDAFIQVPVVRF